LKDLVSRLSPHSVNVLDDFPHGIKTLGVFEAGEVSIELSTGEIESEYYGAPPSIFDFIALVFWPVIGFIVPWGAVRILNWVGAGFISR
jgi:hypothetical protein